MIELLTRIANTEGLTHHGKEKFPGVVITTLTSPITTQEELESLLATYPNIEELWLSKYNASLKPLIGFKMQLLILCKYNGDPADVKKVEETAQVIVPSGDLPKLKDCPIMVY